jgi:transcriptional regulator with XRE-family HTH domain
LFQKNEFKAEVVRRGLTLEKVAVQMGIDAATLHRKMNGSSDFYRSEIEKIIEMMGLSGDDVLRIFFAA